MTPRMSDRLLPLLVWAWRKLNRKPSAIGTTPELRDRIAREALADLHDDAA